VVQKNFGSGPEGEEQGVFSERPAKGFPANVAANLVSAVPKSPESTPPGQAK